MQRPRFKLASKMRTSLVAISFLAAGCGGAGRVPIKSEPPDASVPQLTAAQLEDLIGREIDGFQGVYAKVAQRYASCYVAPAPGTPPARDDGTALSLYEDARSKDNAWLAVVAATVRSGKRADGESYVSAASSADSSIQAFFSYVERSLGVSLLPRSREIDTILAFQARNTGTGISLRALNQDPQVRAAAADVLIRRYALPSASDLSTGDCPLQ